MTQSSVEWLLKNLLINGFLRLTEDEHKLYKEIKEEAKAMHMEEIINAHLFGLIRPLETEATKQAEEYYNETYGNNPDGIKSNGADGENSN